MKLERILKTLIVVVLGTVLFTSCKKDKEESNCRFYVILSSVCYDGTEDEIIAFKQYFDEIEAILKSNCGITDEYVDIRGNYDELAKQKKEQFESAVVPEFTTQTTGTFLVIFTLTGWDNNNGIFEQILSNRDFSNQKE